MKLALRSSLGILLCVAAFVPCRAQKVKPVLNLVKGNTYYNISNSSTSISQTINGQQVNYTIGIDVKLACKVTDIKDTLYNIDVTYQHVGMKMQAAGNTTDYSSESKPTDDPLTQLFPAMLDKPFQMSISKTGRVTSVTGIDKLLGVIFKNVHVADTAQLAQIKAQFEQSFGEKSFKGNLAQIFSIYPSAAVAKGGQWQVDTKLESVINADVKTTFQLQDITADSYVLHGDAKITSVNNSSSQVNGMPVKYNLNGGIVSDITLDKKSGWITSEKQKETFGGSFQILDNPQVPGGMTVPMTISVEGTITDR